LLSELRYISHLPVIGWLIVLLLCSGCKKDSPSGSAGTSFISADVDTLPGRTISFNPNAVQGYFQNGRVYLQGSEGIGSNANTIEIILAPPLPGSLNELQPGSYLLTGGLNEIRWKNIYSSLLASQSNLNQEIKLELIEQGPNNFKILTGSFSGVARPGGSTIRDVVFRNGKFKVAVSP
jgi:hypothetical protein